MGKTAIFGVDCVYFLLFLQQQLMSKRVFLYHQNHFSDDAKLNAWPINEFYFLLVNQVHSKLI
jgi:hypothetical protein